MSKKNGEYRISEAQIRRMRDSGMTASAIGRALGVDRATVAVWFRNFGIPTKLIKVFSDDDIARAIESHRGRDIELR